GPLAEAGAADPLHPAQLRADRLERPVTGAELLALERRRLAGEHLPDVGLRVARVQLAHAADVPGRADPEPVVRLVRPVPLVVPTAEPRAGEVRHLVVLEPGRAQPVDGQLVHRQLVVLADRLDRPAPAL